MWEMTVDVEHSQIAVLAPVSSARLNLPCFYRYETRCRLMSASNFNRGQPCERALKTVLRTCAHVVAHETREIVFSRGCFHRPSPYTCSPSLLCVEILFLTPAAMCVSTLLTPGMNRHCRTQQMSIKLLLVIRHVVSARGGCD